MQGWRKEEEGDREEAVSSPIPAELLVPARPAQLPQAGRGHCLGCGLTAHVCPACSQTSQHHLLCPCLHFLSLPPHHHFLRCLSLPSLSKVGLEMEKPAGKPSRSPSGNQLTPHFRPKLLTSGPSFWVLSLWQRLRQQCLELPGLTMGPSGQMRGWARARGWGPGIRAGAGLGPWAQWVVDQAMWSKRAGARKAEVTERSGEASLICASSDRGWHISLMPRSTDLTLPC